MRSNLSIATSPCRPIETKAYFQFIYALVDFRSFSLKVSSIKKENLNYSLLAEVCICLLFVHLYFYRQ